MVQFKHDRMTNVRIVTHFMRVSRYVKHKTCVIVTCWRCIMFRITIKWKQHSRVKLGLRNQGVKVKKNLFIIENYEVICVITNKYLKGIYIFLLKIVLTYKKKLKHFKRQIYQKRLDSFQRSLCFWWWSAFKIVRKGWIGRFWPTYMANHFQADWHWNVRGHGL